MLDTELQRDAASAHASLLRGRGDQASVLAERAAGHGSPLALAWATAFRSTQALVHGGGRVPALDELDALAIDDPSCREPLDMVCHGASFAALAQLDLPALGRWTAMHDRIAVGLGSSDPRRQLIDARRALAQGDLELVRAICEPLGPREDVQRATAIEACCLSALACMVWGDLHAARDAARRASREARGDGLRPHRFLSGLVLARLRRWRGRAHLAGRILCAMTPQVPPLYRGWLAWELLLAGQAAPPDPGTGPAQQAADELAAMLEAARAGEVEAFSAARDRLEGLAVGHAVLSDEAATLGALIDPRTPADRAPELARPFLVGEAAEVPLGLDALHKSDHAERSPPIAYVLRRPGGVPRRVLAAGTPLAREASELQLTRMKRGRVDLACAALALSRDGLSDEDLFRECYRFRFAPHLHESVLSMLVHRARERLGRGAAITRSDGWVQLEPCEPLLVPDPRCAVNVEGKLLALVARMGSVATRVAARELGVGLRTIQDAVGRLVEEGELSMDRAGRSVSYRLEDTSFGALTPATPEQG